jgi:hypothetical protein
LNVEQMGGNSAVSIEMALNDGMIIECGADEGEFELFYSRTCQIKFPTDRSGPGAHRTSYATDNRGSFPGG